MTKTQQQQHWDTSKLIPKIRLNLKLAGGVVTEIAGSIKIAVPNAHFQCNWPRTKQQYMFYLKEHVSEKDLLAEEIKSTFKYCEYNKIRFIIVCNTFEPKVERFTLDTNDYDIKVVEYFRIDKILKSIIKA